MYVWDVRKCNDFDYSNFAVAIIMNPRRACAARVIVVVLYVCMQGVGNWRNCRPKLPTVAAWIRHEQSFFPPGQRHL